jgi:hypothetical protein
MKRLGLLGGLLAAVFASGWLAAGPALAVTFLLAEWLVNGSAVTTELAVEYSGELELSDKKTLVGTAAVLCSVILDGWVGVNSLAHVSEVLNLSGGAISSTPLTGTALSCTTQKGCETSSAPTVYPLNLPWEGEAELMEDSGSFFAVLLFGSGGNPGWEITCLVLGVSLTDECKPASSGEAVAELILEGATLLANFSEAFTELSGAKLATCSQGGAESGETAGGSTIKLTGGGELSASSEGTEIGKLPTATSLATSLSGEGKQGETLTVLEGSKVKDKVTLSGEKAFKATGKVTYKVYSENTCKTLVANAGEVTVSSGTVPPSNEEELEGGKTYYWQAQYSGDSENTASTSPCTEILSVKAKTSLSTKLSGEGKEGEELTVLEGSKVKDKATLGGTNASSASGKVTYNVYSDSGCKTLVAKAGEGTVSGTSVTASSEEELTGGAPYYWQAEYGGDSLHQSSVSVCEKEISNVKAATSTATSLSNEEHTGEKIESSEEVPVTDTATLSGTKVSSATGTVKYYIYSDKECKTLASEAGEATVTKGVVPSSIAETLPAGTYYWQAVYSGDSLHQSSTSVCGTEISIFKAATQIATSLSGEGQSGTRAYVLEGAPVSDAATLTGPNAHEATGTVKYNVYSDEECKTLVAGAGEVSVSGGSVPASSEETLAAGTYYWQAVYSGDAHNEGSTSACGGEIAVVGTATSLSTSLSGGGHSGATISVVEGTGISDQATLSGTNASKAGGKVQYLVYSDEECKTIAAEAGVVTVTEGNVPASNEVKLPPGAYHWQASYSGEGVNHKSVSSCGSEVSVIEATTSLKTSLSGGGQSGEEISVLEGTGISDRATLSGASASKATGTVKYAIYSDKECKTLLTSAGEVSVSGGSVPASSEETLAAGTYYWQAVYSGDANDVKSTSPCGAEVSVVRNTLLSTSLSGEGHSGERIQVVAGAVHDTATLSGAHASEATGTVKYAIYSDKECKTLVTGAGEVSVSGGSVPASSEETLPAGTYYWQASYSGDSHNEASTTLCGEEVATVGPPSLEVERVDFTNGMPVILDDQNNIAPEAAEAIEEATGHNDIEWEYSPTSKETTKSWPLAYVQATTPEVKARFDLPTATKQLILEKRLEGSVAITGQTTLAGESLTFTKEFASVEELETQVLKHESYIEIESPIKASKPFPEKVGYESMEIKWTWTVKVKGESSAVTESLGSSRLNLFLTYAKPAVTPCQTVAEAESDSKEVAEKEGTGACTPIYFTSLVATETHLEHSGLPVEEEIINSAWDQFRRSGNEYYMPFTDPWRISVPPILVPIARSIQYRPQGPGVGTWVSVPWWWYRNEAGNWTQVWGYKYYQPVWPGRTAAANVEPRGGCGTYAELLVLHIGTCGAFAEAFATALRDQNIPVETINLIVNFGNNNRPCNENELAVCSMLIPNWFLVPHQPGSGDIEFPDRATSLIDTLGVAGQGNENPPPYFWDHEIVKAGQGAFRALYDPSYGTGPFPTETEIGEIRAGSRVQPTQAQVALQFQEASIVGFCRPQRLAFQGLPNRCKSSWKTGQLGLGAVEFDLVRMEVRPRRSWWP